jgi:hypothetical protein
MLGGVVKQSFVSWVAKRSFATRSEREASRPGWSLVVVRAWFEHVCLVS